MTGTGRILDNRRQRDRFTSGPLAAARFVAQRGLLTPVVRSLVRVRVHGRERAPLSGPFILVANHASHLDAPVLLAALPPRTTRRLATGAAADYFFTNSWRRALTILFFNAFEIHRTASRVGACRRLVAEGVPVLLFPEGTRSRTGRIGPLKPGAAALSISFDVPCLPVAIVGAHRAMPPGRAWPVPGRPQVDVVIGMPMRASAGETPAQFTGRLSHEIQRLGASAAGRVPVLPLTKELKTA